MRQSCRPMYVVDTGISLGERRQQWAKFYPETNSSYPGWSWMVFALQDCKRNCCCKLFIEDGMPWSGLGRLLSYWLHLITSCHCIAECWQLVVGYYSRFCMQRLNKLEFRINNRIGSWFNKKEPLRNFSGYLTKSQQFAPIVPHVKPAGSTREGAFSCIDTNELM